ncbi:MAG: peptidylprolyl isomerase [Lysobacterales bacterium CG_4_9_14_3_um_filter_62_6]|nr:MAG: peptidylprolyl isomerase [Xanthomonadales bacterium CG_4_9_14_3_um_filter_62_6]
MIQADNVVSFHYTLTDSDGNTIDSSRGAEGEPLTILLGHGSLIDGVEQALIGHRVGDQFVTTVAPEAGYGVRDETLIQRVPKKYFRDAEHLQPGMVTVIESDRGRHQVTVQKVGSSVIDVDGNHPLAGKTLNFAIEITEVRAASAEEIAHGHVHGSHGHQH